MKTQANKYKVHLLFAILGIASLNACNSQQVKKDAEVKPALKTVFDGKFLMGAALNASQIEGADTAAVTLLKQQFNSIVAENCMKSMNIQPQQGVFTFDLADKFVSLGEANNMFIIGHCLVWHSQTPKWLFIDAEGNDVSRDTLIERMRTHINTVVTRYKGRVNGWDVVNEAVDDQSGLRQSKWLKIIGDDFIELAFKFASEADPGAELYYNDYNLYQPNKRAEVVKLIQNLKAKGIKINGVGMQGHYGLESPKISEVEESILAYAEQGVKVMITELDITVLPFPTSEMTAEISQKYNMDSVLNPYPNELPDSVQQLLSTQYANLFNLFLKYSDNITRVTFWGINDSHSWKNNWPVPGRTDYTLLFDGNNQPKPAFYEVISLVK
jgi:endo-1,4-beta-xylanase